MTERETRTHIPGEPDEADRDVLSLADALRAAEARAVAAEGAIVAIADALQLQPTATAGQCVEAALVLSDALASALATCAAQGRLLDGKHTADDGISLLVSAVLSDAADAPSHAEFRGTYLGQRFALCVQWADGKTPGELINEAMAERDAAVTARNELADAVRRERAAHVALAKARSSYTNAQVDDPDDEHDSRQAYYEADEALGAAERALKALLPEVPHVG